MISTHVLYSEVLYDGRDTVFFFQRSVVLVVYVHDFWCRKQRFKQLKFCAVQQTLWYKRTNERVPQRSKTKADHCTVHTSRWGLQLDSAIACLAKKTPACLHIHKLRAVLCSVCCVAAGWVFLVRVLIGWSVAWSDEACHWWVSHSLSLCTTATAMYHHHL